MHVAPLEHTTPAAAGSPAPSSPSTVDYNSFLRLLIAQLKNQDPLNPADSTEYMAQLAQFSSVEQSIQANQKLDTLLTSMSLSQADSLIGRTVTSTSSDAAGVVTAINITSNGSIALLDNGQTLELGAGIIVH